MLADLTLGDNAFLGMLNNLNRIFHGNNMVFARAVQFIHQTGQGSGFTTANWASDEDNTVVVGQ